jgi:hypothetical protein
MNAELIEALRYCGNFEDRDGCDEECPYFNDKDCPKRIMHDAADALEAANKTVIPHRNYENCHVYWCDCGWFLRNKDHTPNYCPNCGKRIEWENAE